MIIFSEIFIQHIHGFRNLKDRNCSNEVGSHSPKIKLFRFTFSKKQFRKALVLHLFVYVAYFRSEFENFYYMKCTKNLLLKDFIIVILIDWIAQSCFLVSFQRKRFLSVEMIIVGCNEFKKAEHKK